MSTLQNYASVRRYVVLASMFGNFHMDPNLRWLLTLAIYQQGAFSSFATILTLRRPVWKCLFQMWSWCSHVSQGECNLRRFEKCRYHPEFARNEWKTLHSQLKTLSHSLECLEHQVFDHFKTTPIHSCIYNPSPGGTRQVWSANRIENVNERDGEQLHVSDSKVVHVFRLTTQKGYMLRQISITSQHAYVSVRNVINLSQIVSKVLPGTERRSRQLRFCRAAYLCGAVVAM